MSRDVMSPTGFLLRHEVFKLGRLGPSVVRLVYCLSLYRIATPRQYFCAKAVWQHGGQDECESRHAGIYARGML